MPSQSPHKMHGAAVQARVAPQQPAAAPIAQPQQAPSAESRKPAPQKVAGVITGLQEDIRALNSSLLIISQKMQYVVRNEKILGRNLIVLSRKIQALEARSAGGEGGAAGSEFNELKNSFSALAEKVNNFAQRVFDLQAEIDDIKNRYAKQDQLTELKFVIDAINPLQFTTLNQVDELIEKRLKESEKAAAKEKETKEAKETKKR